MSYHQPDPKAGFAPSDHPEWEGRLFLIWPLGVESRVYTNRQTGQPEPTDVVTADIAIVDLMDHETQRPVYMEGCNIGGKGIVPQIKKYIGECYLGRLAKGEKQPGKNAPYFLVDFNPGDDNLADQYQEAFPRQTYASPNGNGDTSWTQSVAAPASSTPAQPAWAAEQTARAAPQNWQQQQMPASAATPPAAPAWGAPQTAASAPVEPWPEGLREFLTARGIPTDGMDVEAAKKLASQLPPF